MRGTECAKALKWEMLGYAGNCKKVCVFRAEQTKHDVRISFTLKQEKKTFLVGGMIDLMRQEMN